jgi:hypothetical protein
MIDSNRLNLGPNLAPDAHNSINQSIDRDIKCSRMVWTVNLNVYSSRAVPLVLIPLLADVRPSSSVCPSVVRPSVRPLSPTSEDCALKCLRAVSPKSEIGSPLRPRFEFCARLCPRIAPPSVCPNPYRTASVRPNQRDQL